MDFADRKPFEAKRLVEERVKDKEKVITVWLNQEEQKLLEAAKVVLEQEKDATALKQLAFIGYETIRKPENSFMLEVIFTNKRRNKRTGVQQFNL
jgi:hypothetical protein